MADNRSNGNGAAAGWVKFLIVLFVSIAAWFVTWGALKNQQDVNCKTIECLRTDKLDRAVYEADKRARDIQLDNIEKGMGRIEISQEKQERNQTRLLEMLMRHTSTGGGDDK